MSALLSFFWAVIRLGEGRWEGGLDKKWWLKVKGMMGWLVVGS